MMMPLTAIVFITLSFSTFTADAALCRSFCNNIPINYPFAIDDGCGAPQFRRMLNCSSAADLFFLTPSGSYKIQTIDYKHNTLVLFDPSMSTCSILQPHHDFLMTDIQSAVIPPSPDTIFALMNCSVDSPVLNHYRDLCFNFSGHTCDELYGGCASFKLFSLLSNSTVLPPCCFTTYATVRMMSMNILDCSHYTTIYGVDALQGVGPMDWLYGIRLSYGIPDLGCDRCLRSGGSCGFDVETQGFLCICSPTMNATSYCVGGSSMSAGKSNGAPPPSLGLIVSFLTLFLSRNY